MLCAFSLLLEDFLLQYTKALLINICSINLNGIDKRFKNPS